VEYEKFIDDLLTFFSVVFVSITEGTGLLPQTANTSSRFKATEFTYK